ncbi:MAG TPA: hypothetical protein PLC85_11090 [Smithellaceae bacterium]|nr:hypothetical protein [Smithellaceae bacterium]
MKYKDGVIEYLSKRIAGEPVIIQLSAKIRNAMCTADRISQEVAGKEIVITSLIDGVHSKNSRHYSGNAFDMRVWIYTDSQRSQITKRLKSELGRDFDVIDEGDHIHIEYDPK